MSATLKVWAGAAIVCREENRTRRNQREREDEEVKEDEPRGGRVEDKGEKEEGRGRNADRGRGKNNFGGHLTGAVPVLLFLLLFCLYNKYRYHLVSPRSSAGGVHLSQKLYRLPTCDNQEGPRGSSRIESLAGDLGYYTGFGAIPPRSSMRAKGQRIGDF